MESITRQHDRSCIQPHNESDIVIGNPTAGRFPWLADESGNLFGSIARGRTARNWGYVLLRRNEQGESEIWKLASGFRDWREAEHQLMLAIDAAEQDHRRRASPRA